MVDPDNENEDEVRDQEADEELPDLNDLFDENDEWDEDMFDRPQRRGQA